VPCVTVKRASHSTIGYTIDHCHESTLHRVQSIVMITNYLVAANLSTARTSATQLQIRPDLHTAFPLQCDVRPCIHKMRCRQLWWNNEKDQNHMTKQRAASSSTQYSYLLSSRRFCPHAANCNAAMVQVSHVRKTKNWGTTRPTSQFLLHDVHEQYEHLRTLQGNEMQQI
jgi:hypothetical protein